MVMPLQSSVDIPSLQADKLVWSVARVGHIAAWFTQIPKESMQCLHDPDRECLYWPLGEMQSQMFEYVMMFDLKNVMRHTAFPFSLNPLWCSFLFHLTCFWAQETEKNGWAQRCRCEKERDACRSRSDWSLSMGWSWFLLQVAELLGFLLQVWEGVPCIARNQHQVALGWVVPCAGGASRC